MSEQVKLTAEEARGLIADDAVWKSLQSSREMLKKAIREVRECLSGNPLTPYVLSHHRYDSTARIDVLDSGEVVIVGAQKEPERRKYTSSLPPLAEIRAMAEEVGIDPLPYGRRKRELLEAIKEASVLPEAESASPPSGGMMRTGSPVVATVFHADILSQVT